MKAPPAALSQDERIMLLGLQARDREIQAQVVEPLEHDFARWRTLVETRLGLKAGALGTTHRVTEQLDVVEAEQPPL